MHIVMFTHPVFLASKSMPKYVHLLSGGLKIRGHQVEILTAKAFFFNLPFPLFTKKWLGYIDQFIIFPLKIKSVIKKKHKDTLFVFSDQALGPWIPLIADRPHVVHCHDFLAQRSALGEIDENKVGISGKIYQAWIRRGYRQGKNFISISQKTQIDLHRFLNSSPKISEVIYNGLNQDFIPGNFEKSRKQFAEEYNLNLEESFVLHVGGNQFYKNRKGVILIYEAWRNKTKENLPLIMIGPEATAELKAAKIVSIYSSEIFFLTDVSNRNLKMAYQAAKVFLFPSLEEGFGWPIAEALASGCPVITTNTAPMNEVGSKSCYYIPRMPHNKILAKNWAAQCAEVLNEVMEMKEVEREKMIKAGIENAKRFCSKKALNDIEAVYHKVMESY